MCNTMGTRTVRLDDKTEASLEQIRQATGLSISEILKRGIRAFLKDVLQKAESSPYEIYSHLDLGPGGYATAPSSDSRRGVEQALKRKHRR
jgi:hypothetical protein